MFVMTAVYPRARGGTRVPLGLNRAEMGLSPRTRGNPADSIDDIPYERSIPAHAGEPLPFKGLKTNGSATRYLTRNTAGTDIRMKPVKKIDGLSPLKRGDLAPPGAGLTMSNSGGRPGTRAGLDQGLS